MNVSTGDSVTLGSGTIMVTVTLGFAEYMVTVALGFADVMVTVTSRSAMVTVMLGFADIIVTMVVGVGEVIAAVPMSTPVCCSSAVCWSDAVTREAAKPKTKGSRLKVSCMLLRFLDLVVETCSACWSEVEEGRRESQIW